MHSAFESLPFRDSAQAERILDSLLVPERPELTQYLADALRETADPTLVLVRFEHYLSACLTPQNELDQMTSSSVYTRLLFTLFDQSQYLTDIACRNPEYMLWLWQEVSLEHTPTRGEQTESVLRQLRAFDAFDARCQSLRRFKRREFLRIGARDVFAHASLASITEDLSNLADAVLEGALDTAWNALSARFGQPGADDQSNNRPATFVILALGKLGGRELNFSSDIDLIFIYSNEGETSGGTQPPISNSEFFHKLGEQIIHAISAHTEEGHVFRVDMRLRPHGRMGSLAVSLDSAVRYYESQGHAWERQAIMKARPAAGDMALGNAFVERTRPFTFPRFFDNATFEDILGMKQQTELHAANHGLTEHDVKLGRGGIRDIEYTVQLLQLLNGGNAPELRAPNTLDAIHALGEKSLLSAFEANTLARNYIFLRQVEHRLQIEGSQQRHALPRDPDALESFARRLGYESGKSFMTDYHDCANSTRAVLIRFFPADTTERLWISDLLNPRTEGASGIEHLAQMGFKDPKKAREELLFLYAGPNEQPHKLPIRQDFHDLAPVLLEAIGATSAPDAVLVHLSRILASQRAPGTIYSILKSEPRLCEHLVVLAASSPYLTEMLIHDPGLFEILADAETLTAPLVKKDLEEELAGLLRGFHSAAAPYRLRESTVLRVGLRDLFGHATVLEVGQELTSLAEVCLAHALDVAHEKTSARFGPVQTPFAVLGLGRFGGCEMSYGSDLDLVFVYDADSPLGSGNDPGEYFAALASHTIRILQEPSQYGRLYNIDARLRPDGRKGMLTVSNRRLLQYYAEEAQPWERLALVKVRAVAGDQTFGQELEQRTRDLAFALELTPDTTARIEDIRRRLVQDASPLDLKRSEGGIAELEFAVRLLQVLNAPQFPDLQRGDVLGAIDALALNTLITPEEFAILGDTYLFFRKVENRIRIMQGRPGSVLPSDPDVQTELAKRLPFDGHLEAFTRERRSQVHALYAKIIEKLIRPLPNA